MYGFKLIMTFNIYDYTSIQMLLFHLFPDDFYEQEDEVNGYVCVFSLKNPSFPEYRCVAHCGIMCVDIHPIHWHMMAVGLSDGNVAVYDLQKPSLKPCYMSTARNGKHSDTVWQVCLRGRS